jgi:hypothetical protein
MRQARIKRLMSVVGCALVLAITGAFRQDAATAATDALSHGSTTVVEPGESMQATFTISITREEH